PRGPFLRLTLGALDDLRGDLVDVTRRDLRTEVREVRVLLEHELAVRDRLRDLVRTDARGRGLGQALAGRVARHEPDEPHGDHVRERAVGRVQLDRDVAGLVVGGDAG